jgi:hypothetical protein
VSGRKEPSFHILINEIYFTPMTFFGTVFLKYGGSVQTISCVNLHSALRNNLIYKYESYHPELQYIIDLSFIFDTFYNKSAEIPAARSP